jgi:outer membrane protein assembly complex protein YaeT
LNKPESFSRPSAPSAIALVLLACSAGFAQEAPTRSRIEAVRIEGLRSVDTSYVRNGLKFAVGDTLSDAALSDRSRESLRSLLGTQLFADASIDFQAGANGVTALVTVEENPVSGPIKFSGNDEFNEKELKEATRLSEGAVLSPAGIERDRNAMKALYLEKGYRLSTIEPKRGTPDAKTGRIPLTWDIEEGAKVRVRDIKLTGNKDIERDDILDVMETKEKRWWRSALFHEDTLASDLQKISNLYREKGYLDAKVDTHWVFYSPSGKRLDVNIAVTEGRRYRRGKVSFSGQDLFNERQLRTQLLIDSGEVLNGLKLDAEEQQLAALYREEGRLFVQINPVKSYRDSIVDVLYYVKEGPPAMVAEVLIEGNTKTRDKVVRRELKIFPGDLYHQSSLMRSQREVMQLNYFDAVVPDIKPTEKEGEINVLFKVTEKEKGTGTFSAGAAYSQNDGLTGTLGLQIPNIFGRGQRVDFSLQYGEYNQTVKVGLTEPWLFDTPTGLGGSVFYTHTVDQYTSGYDFTSYGFSSNLSRRLKWPDDYFSVGAGYTISQNRYGSQYAAHRSGYLIDDGLESSISLSLTRNDKDLPVFPTQGSVYSLSWRKIGGPLGGDFDYSQSTTSAKWWFPTFWKLVLGIEASGGILQGDRMQASDLYRMGGMLGYAGKLRGYNPGSVGSSRMGRSFLSTSAELRLPVAENIFYVIGFADAGNVFGRSSRKSIYNNPTTSLESPWLEIDPADLKRDVGLGFRLQIPMMGILGFDFGYGFDAQEDSYGQPYRMTNPWVANFVIETGM